MSTLSLPLDDALESFCNGVTYMVV